MANEKLTRAKSKKNDEFFTQYNDIQQEINAYLEYNPNVFREKTILLPADDPEWSNFTKFFSQNFERLGLKKLISTSYAYNSKPFKENYQLTLFESESPKYDEKKSKSRGKIFILCKDRDYSGRIDINDLKWDYLKGDGDFKSPEVCKLRDEADIIITNPPFSLFREFVSWIFDAKKEFIIIGNQNAITYKEVFPYIMKNEMWMGASSCGKDMVFGVPMGSSISESDRIKAEKLGYKGNYTRMGNCCWFTNIDHGRRHQPMKLMTLEDNLKYSKHKNIKDNGYQKYDNYDAIDISYTDSIPSNYKGIMGVPISFLYKYNPSQFKIVGQLNVGCYMDEDGWKGSNGLNMLLVNGKTVYKRILIQSIEEEEENENNTKN